jgi:hypothetical protein
MRTMGMKAVWATGALLAVAMAAPAVASEPAAEGQLALGENETFLLPIDEPGNRLPEYPQAVLTQQQAGAHYVCMRVDIDEEGKVTYAGPLVRDTDCPPITELTKQFSDAATAALTTWRFEPAIKCVFRSQRAKEAAGMSCSGGREVPQATSLTFRFLFEQVEGRGVVRMQR